MKKTGSISWRMRTGRKNSKKAAEINRVNHGCANLLKRYELYVDTVMTGTGITADGAETGSSGRKRVTQKDITHSDELKMVWGSIITVALYECRRLVIWGHNVASGKRH